MAAIGELSPEDEKRLSDIGRLFGIGGRRHYSFSAHTESGKSIVTKEPTTKPLTAERAMLQDSKIGIVTSGDPFGYPPRSKYENLISLAKEVPPVTTVVVHPCDETSLRGACEAAELGIIVPILVGPLAKITAVAKQHGIDIARYELVDAPHSEAAAAKAVELIRQSKGELLMKGSLHTDELIREVTAGTTGLRTARRISHVFIMDVPTYMRRRFSSPMPRSTSSPISMPSATSCRTPSICLRRPAWARLGLPSFPRSRR